MSQIRKKRRIDSYSQIFHNFGSISPICKFFTFLEMALKFVGSFCVVERGGIKNKAATAKERFYFFKPHLL